MAIFNHLDDIVSEVGTRRIFEVTDKPIDGNLGEAVETLVEGVAIRETKDSVMNIIGNIWNGILGDSDS